MQCQVTFATLTLFPLRKISQMLGIEPGTDSKSQAARIKFLNIYFLKSLTDSLFLTSATKIFDLTLN